MLSGCSGQKDSSIISNLIPENIESVVVSGNDNGELEPWELDSAGIEELKVWVDQLSLKHRTYEEKEAPNEKFAGGITYTFNFNDGELSFTYSDIDKAYIWYNDEWYEITNPTDPPVGNSDTPK